MTTVRSRQLTALRDALAWLDPDRAVVDRGRALRAGRDARSRSSERSISQMDTSKIDATVRRADELTDYPKEHGDGV